MYQFTDFNHFIEIYMLAASAMQTAEDFAFMVEQFLRGQAEQNIRYSEAFLSASLLLKKLPAAELIQTIIQAARQFSGFEVFSDDLTMIVVKRNR